MAEEERDITEIVNELISEEQETEPIEVDVEKAKQSEAQSRDNAMKDVRKQQTSSMVSEAKKATGSYKAQMEAQAKEIKELKDMVKGLTGKTSSMENDLKVHSDRMLTDDVIAQENELAKSDKYGKFFNRDEVRKFYINAAEKEKRFFSPPEAMKLIMFDKLLDKLDKYERANEFDRTLKQGAFTHSTETVEEDASDVKDISDIGAMMRKQAEKLGLR